MNFLKANGDSFFEQLLTVINSIPYPVYWTDVECKLVGANTALLELLNIRCSQKLGISDLYEKIADTFDLKTNEKNEFKLDDLNIVFSKQKLIKIYQTNHIKYQINKVPLVTTENQEILGMLCTFTALPNIELISTKKNKTSKNKSNKIRALIIEDNKIAAEVTQSLFLSLKCYVDIALNAEAALELFNKNKYNFILMDIELSDTSGYILSKKLRQIEKAKKTIIIALTTYKADVVKYDCGDYQMNAVVSKPLSLEQANNIIEKYVHQQEVTIPGLLELEIC